MVKEPAGAGSGWQSNQLACRARIDSITPTGVFPHNKSLANLHAAPTISRWLQSRLVKFETFICKIFSLFWIKNIILFVLRINLNGVIEIVNASNLEVVSNFWKLELNSKNYCPKLFRNICCKKLKLLHILFFCFCGTKSSRGNLCVRPNVWRNNSSNSQTSISRLKKSATLFRVLARIISQSAHLAVCARWEMTAEQPVCRSCCFHGHTQGRILYIARTPRAFKNCSKEMLQRAPPDLPLRCCALRERERDATWYSHRQGLI